LLVYVENDALIEYFMKKYSQKYKCSFMKSSSNNTQRMINDYSRHALGEKKIDVVFSTSVAKLGMNLDVHDLYLYHLPQNYKDILQWCGRIGRFGDGEENSVYSYYPEKTLESAMYFKRKKEAETYIDNFF
jgi:superfamily II DNA/RNA helicase